MTRATSSTLATIYREQKLAPVREETKRANSVFMGDGINDAPALTVATVGIAVGQGSEVTSEAAGVVTRHATRPRRRKFVTNSPYSFCGAGQSNAGPSSRS